MSEKDLICNFKNCKKILTESAFITRCSHVFCEEDAIREIESQNGEKECPACHSPLTKSYELVKVVLNPTEQFKSMVLAGIRPEYVMDIATRAIMFWIYQLQQQILNQKIISKSSRDSVNQMKLNFDVEFGILKAKIQDRERKIDELEKELENQNRKFMQLSMKLSEKTGEVQRWQMAYEKIRKEQIAQISLQQSNDQAGIGENKSVPVNFGPQTMDELLELHKGRCGVTPQGQLLRSYEMGREECGPRRSNEKHRFYFQPQPHPHLGSPKAFFDHDDYKRNTGERVYKH